MTTLTLLTKINSDSQLKQVAKALKFAFEGLEVEAKILGTVANGWVQITLAGEDEEIATNYLIKEMGLFPSSFGNVKRFSTLNGYISTLKKNGAELSIDVGVFEPKISHATIPLPRLQAQLVDGRKIALGKTAELYGFCEGVQLSIKLSHLNEEERRMEAELSLDQTERYQVWRESLLDRLLVLGARGFSLHEVTAIIEHA